MFIENLCVLRLFTVHTKHNGPVSPVVQTTQFACLVTLTVSVTAPLKLPPQRLGPCKLYK